MFKNQSLRGRIIAAFGFMGVLILVMALIGLFVSSRLSQDVQVFAGDVYPATVSLWKINEGKTQIQSSERLLLNDTIDVNAREKELKRIEDAWKQINEGFENYASTPKDKEEDDLYRKFTPLWDTWKQTHEKFIKLNEAFEQDKIANPRQRELELLTQGRNNAPELGAIRQAIKDLDAMTDLASGDEIQSFQAASDALLNLLDYHENLATQQEKSSVQDINHSRFWIVTSLIIGPLTAILFGLYFSNLIIAMINGVVDVAQRISAGDLTSQVKVTDQEDEIGKLLKAFHRMNLDLNTLIRQVQQSGIQITTSATQIAASGKELEATVAEQLASTNEVSATSQEIAATSRELVRTMEQVTGSAQSTAISAGNSQEDLIRMERVMRQLSDATSSISSKLGVMNEKANNINSVVTTITKVADQTNLLSLNAAIEAEKAGEYGAGFAVVAREIRRLADQTAVATLEIEQMVKEMQVAVSSGVMEMDKFNKSVVDSVVDVSKIGDQIAQVISQVQSLTPRFEQVGHSMEEQSEGAQQISEAMSQLTQASQQTVDALRETNNALEQLDDAAQGLRSEVSRFRVS